MKKSDRKSQNLSLSKPARMCQVHPDYWIFEDITYVEIALSVFDAIRKQGQLLKENRVFQREYFCFTL